MLSPWSLDEMLAEFRVLGGTADNVVPREGAFGLGLFPIDPAQPVDLHIPASMLVPCRHVRQEGDDLIVSPESNLDPRVMDFFTRYQRAFSWGSAARAGVEAFRQQFAEPPDEIMRALAQIGIKINRPLGQEWAPFELFKRARFYTYHGERVFFPVIDLINHGREAQYDVSSDGVRVAGSFQGEVLVHYGPADSLYRFFVHQFASEELAAFSLTITIPVSPGGKTLIIDRRISENQAASAMSLLPVVQEDNNRIMLSHLMLGNERMPRLPRTLFRQILPSLTTEQADELFQRIVTINIQRLIDLLDTLDAHESELARQIRKAARLQLKGIAQSYGARDPGAVMPLRGDG